jgi:hypothetical protein
MKTMLIVLATYCCMWPVSSASVPATFAFNLPGRHEPADAFVQQSFIHLIAHRQQRIAALRWHVADPSAIAGFDVERSYDGEFYDVIAALECNNQSMHQHTDQDVFPGNTHYRIKAYLFNGDVVYSDVATVRIVQKK